MDLAPLPVQPKSSKGFSRIFKNLKRIGYKRGLSYQTLPYNFIQSYRLNIINKIFKSNLKRLYQLTGKSSIVIAHSMGNLNVKHQLSKLTQEFKDKHIKMWLAAGSPFSGAMSATNIVIGGMNLTMLWGKMGFHFESAAEGLGSTPSVYELMLKNMYMMYQNEPWFDWVVKQIQYEQGKIPKEKTGMSFWPSKEENCTYESFTNISSKCITGLEDMRKYDSVIVDGKGYSLYDNKQMIQDWPLRTYSLRYFESLQDPEYDQMNNPGVPVVTVYSKTNGTTQKITFKDKITDYTSKKEYPKSTETTGYGDGTVPTNSAIIAPIKWAYEFENKESFGSKGKDYKVGFIISSSK